MWLSPATWHTLHTRLQRLWDAPVDIGHGDRSYSMRTEIPSGGAEPVSSAPGREPYDPPIGTSAAPLVLVGGGKVPTRSFPESRVGTHSNSSEHLRQIGADQVTALVQVRAVLFRAVAPCSRVTTTNVESAIGSTHSVRTRGGNTRKADNTHTADRRRSLGSTSIVATASRRDRYRPHLV
jgi:hypothetical protein